MLTAGQITETDQLARYLVGSSCPESAAADYWQAIEKLGGELDAHHRQVWERMMQSALLLRCVDAGLALTSPSSAIRKRIFVMFCILETEPSLALHFLPMERGLLYLPVATWHGVRAVFAAFVGLLLVKVWRLT
jgi:hypothetical protein